MEERRQISGMKSYHASNFLVVRFQGLINSLKINYNSIHNMKIGLS